MSALADQEKREAFVHSAPSMKEKEFWKLFFSEVDKRRFLTATFISANFGVRIHNKRIITNADGNYSLMFTRNGSFKMNDKTIGGKSWNAVERLRNWCLDPQIADRFYASLKANKLIDGIDSIDIPRLVSRSTPEKIINDIFSSIDLFK